MNFKPVDLQLAVHRNGDAGQLQNQMQQKPMLDQAATASAMHKNAEANRTRSEKSEASAKASVRDERKRAKQDRNAADTKGSAKDTESAAPSCEHPYKGHRIDLLL